LISFSKVLFKKDWMYWCQGPKIFWMKWLFHLQNLVKVRSLILQRFWISIHGRHIY